MRLIGAGGEIDHALRHWFRSGGRFGAWSIEFLPSRNKFFDELFGV
jgi:hypothetical protein